MVCAPDDLAVAVAHFLRGAEVVAVVPAQDVDFWHDGCVGPHRVGFRVVGAAVVRLFEQAHGGEAQGLGHGDEGAGFIDVVDGAPGVAVDQGWAGFPGQGIAVPAIKGVATAQFALFEGVLVDVPLRAGGGIVLEARFGVFAQAPAQAADR